MISGGNGGAGGDGGEGGLGLGLGLGMGGAARLMRIRLASDAARAALDAAGASL